MTDGSQIVIADDLQMHICQGCYHLNLWNYEPLCRVCQAKVRAKELHKLVLEQQRLAEKLHIDRLEDERRMGFHPCKTGHHWNSSGQCSVCRCKKEEEC